MNPAPTVGSQDCHPQGGQARAQGGLQDREQGREVREQGRAAHVATLGDAYEHVPEALADDVEAVLEAPEDLVSVQRLVRSMHLHGERSRRHTVQAYLDGLRAEQAAATAGPASLREGAAASGTPPVRLTRRQGEYVSFIRDFTRLNRKAPSEAEIARYFGVRPPSVHTMVLKLEKVGAISRRPRTARSIRVLVPCDALPAADPPPSQVTAAPPISQSGPAVQVACRVVSEIFAETERTLIDDQELVPILEAVARAAEGALLAAEADPAEARAAKEEVLLFAERTYVALCAEHDPEGADEEEDSQRFRACRRDGR